MRSASDESHVIDLCDRVLSRRARRQFKFEFLLGDTGIRLPVDAYFPDLRLAVEYRERQHSETVAFFDKPERLSASGVGRAAQRQIYDERRRSLLPQHGIQLIEFDYTQFPHNRRKRLLRFAGDVEIVRNVLQPFHCEPVALPPPENPASSRNRTVSIDALYRGTIIGIDCATQPKNTGLTSAFLKDDRLRVREVRCASAQLSAADIVAQWIEESGGAALLALDAPLGWPAALGAALALHRAGDLLSPQANLLFRRKTDREIYTRLGKLPLDVGADRIARTAHTALALLDDLRRRTSLPIPLAWTPKEGAAHLSAIEVYPAATRLSLGLLPERGSLAGLEDRVEFINGAKPASEHERDAVICAIAGWEFLAGRTISPANSDQELVRQEGWIWAGPAM